MEWLIHYSIARRQNGLPILRCSALGDCFIISCCEWKERQDNDLCGLDRERISAGEKARLLAERSALKEALEEMRMQG